MRSRCSACLPNPCAFSQASTLQRAISTSEANYCNYLPDHILSVCETPVWKKMPLELFGVLNVQNVSLG